jgi:short-subunit dehydrogenase
MNTKKTILITGATAGIGRHTALHLARSGHRVIATGRRTEALDALREQARKEGTEVETLLLDVSDPGSIKASALAVGKLTDGRGVDVLVNNAGYGHAGPLEGVSDAELRAQFETNVFGLMATIRAFVPKMRARGWGRVINISSIGGRVTFPFLGAYNATKYAVEALSDALRIELGAFGIRVVLVEPGSIRTEFSDRAMATVAPGAAGMEAYAPVLARKDELAGMFDSFAVGPEHVARAIERAIDARRPAARYVVPFRARLILAFFRWMPVPITDALFSVVVGLTRRRMRAAAQSAAALQA